MAYFEALDWYQDGHAWALDRVERPGLERPGLEHPGLEHPETGTQ